jgi:hypothetical protein
VWFFANRGEDWRLYGYYVDTEDDNEDEEESLPISYEVYRLLRGKPIELLN